MCSIFLCEREIFSVPWRACHCSGTNFPFLHYLCVVPCVSLTLNSWNHREQGWNETKKKASSSFESCCDGGWRASWLEKKETLQRPKRKVHPLHSWIQCAKSQSMSLCRSLCAVLLVTVPFPVSFQTQIKAEREAGGGGQWLGPRLWSS